MNIRLVRLREEHLEQVREWRMREDITKYMNTDPIITPEQQVQWFRRVKQDETQRHWIILVDGVPSGVMNIFDIDVAHKRCSWGYYVARKEVRSLQLAVYLEWNLYDYVFDVLKLHKLCNETFTENSQVIKLHKLCGGHEDGIMREHIFKNGYYYDVSVGSILESEWRQKKAEIQYVHFTFE